MASRIQGITVEIGGDTTKLSSALSGVNKEIKNTQSQLKDVEKLLKLDPTNTEFLAQKQRLLGDAIKETKDKLDTLKTAASQANEQLQKGDITQEQYDGLQREIQETEQKLKSLEEQAAKTNTTLLKIDEVGGKLKDVGDKVSGVGTALMPVSAGVTALGTAAVKMTSDFDSGMSRVAAISGATDEELARLRQTAKDLGASTAFSASEAAAGMENLASAGFEVNEIIEAMPGMLDLAASSGEDLASGADIAASTLRGFGMDASEAGHVADVLAQNAAATNAAVADTGEAMKYIAPLANTVGLEFEEVAASIGIMANAGIKGSQAGTTLRGALSRLIVPFPVLLGKLPGHKGIKGARTVELQGSCHPPGLRLRLFQKLLVQVLEQGRLAVPQAQGHVPVNEPHTTVNHRLFDGLQAVLAAHHQLAQGQQKIRFHGKRAFVIVQIKLDVHWIDMVGGTGRDLHHLAVQPPHQRGIFPHRIDNDIP